MEHGRGKEHQVSGVYAVIFQLDLIGAASFLNEGELCFIVPVSKYGGSGGGKPGGVLLQGKSGLAVAAGLFLFRQGRSGSHGDASIGKSKIVQKNDGIMEEFRELLFL
jgi:hypothetical protein